MEVIVYVTALIEDEFFGSRVVNNLAQFMLKSDVIVANRLNAVLQDVANKVYTRDLFGSD